MCKYYIIKNLAKLRSMTGLTTDEFYALVPIFHTAFEAYMKRRTIDGRIRYHRRYVSYANSPLPTNRRYIALYFDLPKTKSKASNARTRLSNEPIKREQMGASFARSAELRAITA